MSEKNKLATLRDRRSHKSSPSIARSEKKAKQPNTVFKRIFTWTLLCILRLLVLISVLGIFCFIAIVESHTDNRPANQTFPIVDVGFKVTQPVHRYLSGHPDLHHLLASLNTLGIYSLLLYSILYVGYYQGRPGLVVVEMGLFIVRLICGWLTQSPYSPEYLSSSHDFPDSIINQFRDPLSHKQQHVSFFFFFSGHVALVSLFRTYFKRKGHYWSSSMCDLFNALQVIRLLGTRGHYTIDLIGGAFIGNYVHSFVADADAYLESFAYMRYLVRHRDTYETRS